MLSIAHTCVVGDVKWSAKEAEESLALKAGQALREKESGREANGLQPWLQYCSMPSLSISLSSAVHAKVARL